jgi:hypothetical protein
MIPAQVPWAGAATRSSVSASTPDIRLLKSVMSSAAKDGGPQ